MSAAAARVLLVRHGVTAWNLEERYDSHTDLALHPSAERLLETAFRRLDKERPDRILVSPSVRARQTAALFAARSHPAPPVLIRGDLRELDFGRFEGRSKRELITGSLAPDYRRWLTGPDGEPAAPDGEPFPAAVTRAGRVLAEAAERGGTTLVVSHGYLLRAMLVAATGLTPAAARRLRWPNGGVVTLIGDGENWAWPTAHGDDPRRDDPRRDGRRGHGQDGSSSWQMTSSRTSQPRG